MSHFRSPWDYVNWAAGQPDNRGNRQKYVVINYKQFATFDYESADEAIGAFADVSSSMLLPYVCQFPATATTDEKLW